MSNISYRPHFFPEEEQLRRARRPYIRHLDPALPAMDLGCGRGEVLQLMQEHQVDATGIESDPNLIRLCQQKGLKVEQSDITSFLKKQSAATWGSVFIGHLIEHLTTADAHTMIAGVHDALTVGGKVIVLTPNPNWLPGVGEFWSDPTHIRPWPISAITSLLEDHGFHILDAGVDPATRLRPNWCRPVSALIDCCRLFLLKLLMLQNYDGGEIFVIAEKV